MAEQRRSISDDAEAANIVIAKLVDAAPDAPNAPDNALKQVLASLNSNVEVEEEEEEEKKDDGILRESLNKVKLSIDNAAHKPRQKRSKTGSKLNLKDWVRGKELGKGSYGKVFIYEHSKTNERVAMKVINLSEIQKKNEAFSNEIHREVEVLRSLNHRNIVQLKHFRRTRKTLHICMEFVRGQTITALYEEKGPFEEKDIAKYTVQILGALQYAHSRDVIHRDLKGQNILISEGGVVKICDFGSSKIFPKGTSSMVPSASITQTVIFAAPEMMSWENGAYYGVKADVWSLGCVLIEMASAQLPWHEVPQKSKSQFLREVFMASWIAQEGHVPAIPTNISAVCQDFIAVCLRRDQGERYSADQLLWHAFVYEE